VRVGEEIEVTDSSSVAPLANPIVSPTPVDEEPQRGLVTIVARNSAFVLGVQVILKVLALLFNVLGTFILASTQR
jgi:hypothetical protein